MNALRTLLIRNGDMSDTAMFLAGMAGVGAILWGLR